MFREKLRELGLVSMEKEAVAIATYSVLEECRENRATLLRGAGRKIQKIPTQYKGKFLT